MSGIQGRSPRVKRAVRKRLVRKFKVGDRVTWGLKHVANPVIDVTEDGLFVDSSPFGKRWFVPWTADPEIVGPKWKATTQRQSNTTESK